MQLYLKIYIKENFDVSSEGPSSGVTEFPVTPDKESFPEILLITLHIFRKYVASLSTKACTKRN
jgi:hypothetical protein